MAWHGSQFTSQGNHGHGSAQGAALFKHGQSGSTQSCTCPGLWILTVTAHGACQGRRTLPCGNAASSPRASGSAPPPHQVHATGAPLDLQGKRGVAQHPLEKPRRLKLKMLEGIVPQCSPDQAQNFRQAVVAAQVPPWLRLQPCGVGVRPAPWPSFRHWPRRPLRHQRQRHLLAFSVAEPAAVPQRGAAPPADGVPRPTLLLALPSADAVFPHLLFYGAAPLHLGVPVVPCPPDPCALFPSARCQGSGQLTSGKAIFFGAGQLPVQPSKPRVPSEPRAVCWPQRVPSALV